MLEYLDRPIAYHRAFVPLAGITGAVFLSQAVYWSKRTNDPDGWFYKTRDDWKDETGLTRQEQETVRRKLVKAGIISEERRGVPAKMYYRVNLANLTSWLETSQQDGWKPADKSAEKPPTIIQRLHTEITHREAQNFDDLIKPFLGKYSPAMIAAFTDYWRQKNAGGKKEHWQMQRVFDMERRLATWARNDEKFNHEKSQRFIKIDERPTHREQTVERQDSGFTGIGGLLKTRVGGVDNSGL